MRAQSAVLSWRRRFGVPVAAPGRQIRPVSWPDAHVWWALGIVSGLAALLWLAGQLATAWAPKGDIRSLRGGRFLPRASVLVAWIAGAVAVVTLGVPGLIWLSDRLLRGHGGLTVSGSIGGVLLTYLTSLATVAWRNRKKVTDKTTGVQLPKAAPRGPVQLALVILTLLVLAAGWLLLFGGMATVGLRPLGATSYWVLGALLAVVLFLGALTDETTLSLHMFYRRRLASAFAVRRVRQGDAIVARPYPPEQRTSLSRFAAPPSGLAFPHVIFAASATLDDKRAAPGADRVSYTFCSHQVGGPDVGYVSSARLEELAPKRLRRDLTVQSAVALSGAAIAASIGGQRTAWYETLLVVSGVRLGAWMPNPAYVIGAYTRTRTWREAGLPRARRLTYLLRELFGAHPSGAPLLQITDGGFYDNLGLVELFRRRCTRIYCIDASGDNPPAATTLAQALTLAYEELGVVTTLEGSTWSSFTMGGGEALEPKDPLAALSARLSRTGIIRGTFRYPDAVGVAGEGRLVVAKSSLWSTLPYEVLAYAQSTPTFPRDSTGDQFFDDRQYAAYTALGRELGTAAVEAMDRFDLAPAGPGGDGQAPSPRTGMEAAAVDRPH